MKDVERDGPAGALLGLDFGGTKIACALADTDGAIVDRVELPTLPEAGAEQAVARAIDAAHVLCGTRGASVAGVGVSTMGITTEDAVTLAPNVAGWAELRLPAALRNAFEGLPIAIDNDVKAAGLAEATWGALRGVDCGIQVNLGSGIAAALVIGGQVVRGAHGAAGEVGYWRREPVADLRAPDGRAPFEEFAGGAGVRERVRTELGLDGGYATLMGRSDAPAVAMLAGIRAEICWHVSNLAIALDPSVIALGGGYTRAPGSLLDELRDALAATVPYPPAVAIGRFAGDGGLHGSLALALAAAELGT